MSKKKKNRQIEGQAEGRQASSEASPEGRALGQETGSPLQTEQVPSGPRPPARKYFFIFWGIIILALVVSWTLAAALPSVHESLIERWVMAGMAAALAVFLFFFK